MKRGSTQSMGSMSALPDVPVVSLDFYHALYGKNESFKGNLVLVFYHDYYLLYVSLRGGVQSYSIVDGGQAVNSRNRAHRRWP